MQLCKSGVFGDGPRYGLCLNPATTAAHTAGYAIELTTGECFTIRFVVIFVLAKAFRA